MIRSVLSVIFLVLIFCLQTQASVLDELNADQKTNLLNHSLVVATEKVPGYPWPKLRMYILVKSTPEEAAAVGMDYELRPTYSAGLKSAKIAKTIDPATCDVDYLVKVPVLSDEHFTLFNHMGTYDDGHNYRIEFHLVRGDRTKVSDGTNRFEGLGNNSVYAVVTFVDPGSSLAGLAWKHALHQAEGAVTGFRDQVELEKSQNPEKLAQQLARLRAAMKSH